MTVSGIQGAMARVNQILAAVPGAQPAPPPAPTPPGADFASQLQAAQRSGLDKTAPATMDPNAPVRQKIVSLAQAEVGKGESPKGSNDGPDIRRYHTATEGAAVGQPWCSYWTSYIWAQAGQPVGSRGQGLGWVPDVEKWGKDTGRWVPSGTGAPGAGDLILFDRNGDGLTDHIGVIESVRADGGVNTIEGNTGTQDVARRSYGAGEWYGTVRAS